MNPDCPHARRIRDLDLWQGPISVEPLPGGITNHNFLVRDGERRFVARLREDRSVLGIDRRNEVACQRAAWAFGIAPEVVQDSGGVLVSAFLDARTATPESVRDPAFIPRLAAVLRRLHESWDRLSGELLYFSPFQTVRTYARTARAIGASLPVDADDLLEDTGRLARRIGPFTPTLCHNDLLAANILDDGDRVWLVDWEYAGVGHPLFDLAGISSNCGFSDAMDRALLRAYRGSVRRRDLRELRILKAISLLREALWAVIQAVASDIDFDYHKYAFDNFAAYRSARPRPGPGRRGPWSRRPGPASTGLESPGDRITMFHAILQRIAGRPIGGRAIRR
jgi:thiamine kinase-like enzyme